MKRVTPQPILPREYGQENWHAALIRLLREYSDSINQAADLRLWEFVTVTGTYTSGINDHVILLVPSGTFTLTIPAASVMRNKRIIIKRNNNTTHTITVQSSSGTIDGAASVNMTTAWQVKEFYSDGVGWIELLGGTAGSAGTITESFVVPISDETTALTTGTKRTWRMPYAFTLTDVRASVSTAQTGGSILTFDVHESGTSVLSTKVTIDNNEKTSTTAATQRVISDAAIANDAELTFDIDVVGTSGAKGAVITLIGYK